MSGPERRIGAAFRLRSICLSTAIFAASCVSLGSSAAQPRPDLADRRAVRVDTYASQPELVDSVNTHWIDTPAGLIVVDTQRIVPEARQAIRHIQATGRPVVAILITHPHTDHYGGLPLFRKAFQNARVYASAGTIRSMREDTKGYNAARRKRHGDAFVAQQEINRALPNIIVSDGQRLSIAGIPIEVAEYRENEAEVTTLFYLPSERALFAGDLVNDGFVAVPFEGIEAWLAQLDQIEKRFPNVRTIYMGHGVPGPAANRLSRQRAYLQDLRSLVKAAVADNVLSAEDADRVAFEMERRHPFWHGVGGQPRQEVLRFTAGLVAKQYGARVEDVASFR